MGVKKEGARIYNLFPRIVGRMSGWGAHFDRIADMGFNWVYVNPLHYPGFSGSLYAPKDYYAFNPLFLDPNSTQDPMKQLETMLSEAHKRNLRVMMDFVINHTAKDHPFTKQHPSWYKKNERGELKSPGAWDNNQYIEWGDLAEIDNESSPEKAQLWNYWKELAQFYIKKGFDGFRADAAYKVPTDLWSSLIMSAKNANPSVQFFAESLGCPVEQTVALGKAGFDYIFNSSKWWDYSGNWLLEHYFLTRETADSVSFPESHDTQRLSVECKNDQNAVKQRSIFTALFSTGWMIPVGFEYGFRKKLDVVQMTTADWEKVNYDLTKFLKKLNELKKSYQIFNEESDLEVIDQANQTHVLALLRTSLDEREKVLVLINKDTHMGQRIALPTLKNVFGADVKSKPIDISLEKKLNAIPMNNFECLLDPSEIKLVYLKK